MTNKDAIYIKGLKKTFDDNEYILNGVDLAIPKGSLTVIIGFSGTGKSVLIKHILGLVKPTSGQIEILGQDLNLLSSYEMVKFRTHFGVLFQNAALFDDMTTFENVRFPLQEHRRDWSKNQIDQVVREKLSLVGLDEKHYKKLPSELSGGMRKRVGLARAIALDPEILIYDEPTTGLDPVRTEMVDELIVNTHQLRKGSTSFVVSHDLNAAFRIGDYVAMLDSGKVLLFGTPKDFFDSEIELVRRFISKGVRRQ